MQAKNLSFVTFFTKEFPKIFSNILRGLSRKIGSMSTELLTRALALGSVPTGEMRPDLSKPQERRELMTRKDLLLLVLASAEGQSFSPVQLQKSLFLVRELMSNQLPDAEFYDFQPYHYGPFDKTIYSDAEISKREGLVNITPVPGQQWNRYSISAEGIIATQGFQMSDKARRNVKKIVDWVRGMSFEQLISTIYKHYPRFKENSVFQG